MHAWSGLTALFGFSVRFCADRLKLSLASPVYFTIIDIWAIINICFLFWDGTEPSRTAEGGVSMAYISLDQVVKRYQMGEVTITAADHITFDVEKGEFVIIVGPSGAGKTTVLNILGGMDSCDEGTITVDGSLVSSYNSRQLTTYRRYDIGFVFQFYNLVQNLTALENVELAAQICKHPLDAEEVLRHVGLGDRLNNFPAQLSGGEQQRVAIARALAKNPKLLLCDEPTGALDYVTGKSILKLLQDTCRKEGMTVIVITHKRPGGPHRSERGPHAGGGDRVVVRAVRNQALLSRLRRQIQSVRLCRTQKLLIPSS